MLWGEDIPTVSPAVGVEVDVMAGRSAVMRAVAAAGLVGVESDPTFAIWLIRLEAGATWELPATEPGVNRMLHFFDGDTARVGSTRRRARAPASGSVPTSRSDREHRRAAEFLLLQGRPSERPVIQMGPFVMNTPEEIQQASGGLPGDGIRRVAVAGPDPVHARTDRRFAIHADGHVEHRDMAPVGGD
jgi:quercetin 2,3-dioxygenase